MRGIVSLTAALAIPFKIADGSPFPERDMILFLTFCVIVVTLVGEGLTLPFVTRALGLANAGQREREDERREEYKVRRRAIEAAIERLDALAAERELPEVRCRSRCAPFTATGSSTPSTAPTATDFTKSSSSSATKSNFR